jgi:hypothetical protein
MKNIFTVHPSSIGESYFQHMKFAGGFGFNMLLGGLACILHAVFPFLFETTGSDVLAKMTRHFVERMPRVEGSVVHLSEIIEKKMVNTRVSSSVE